jgi:hypothetical protein
MNELLTNDKPNLYNLSNITMKYKDEIYSYRNTTSKFGKKIIKILNDKDNIEEISNELKEDFERTIKSIEDLRFSNKSKIAFQLIKKLASKNTRIRITFYQPTQNTEWRNNQQQE